MELWPNGEGAKSNDLRNAGSNPASSSKLYGIVRSDLGAGLQAAQLGHALIAFVLARPREAAQWHAESNNLVCLAAPDEPALAQLAVALIGAGLPVVCFHEPDLDGQLTAIATGPEAQRFLSNYPLALRP